ncbi:MAG: hypothetical protein CHACPFDD_00258 [Phycisphaerae bacterium]|nr:hypothetical protein [Phycisphaerae bacterium]
MANATPAAPQRILIIKPSSLGDVVHALPVLAALRGAFPRAHIAWLIGRSFAPLLDGHPLLDELIPFDRARYGRMLRSPRIFVEFLQFTRALRARRFDLVIDLQGLIRSGFLAWASGAALRAGFSDARELAWIFYNRRLRAAPGRPHAVQRNLDLLVQLGVAFARPAEFPLAVSPDELDAARRRLTAAGCTSVDFIAVAPGARWASKQWGAARFAELIRRAADAGLPRCVLLGSPDDRAIADEIARELPSGVAVNLAGQTTLRELTAILSLSRLVLSCDSGPMHIAAALSRPLVALFGPTDPARTGPYDAEPHADRANLSILRRDLPCAPCLRRTCPLGHQACMTEMAPAEVLRAIQDVLGRAARRECAAAAPIAEPTSD